jgi:glycosyltransferase 2 family protein
MNKFSSGALKASFGYILAAACLVWVFHDIRFDSLFSNLGRTKWGLVGLGLGFDVLSYVLQGARWHLLLRPVGPISIVRTIQATYAGLFINEVLPMRVGEIARGYLVSRWMSTGFARILPSMAMERLFEGIWLAAGIGITAMFVPLPVRLIRSADILGGLVLALTVVFVILVFRAPRRPEEGGPGRASNNPIARAKSILAGLGSGFRAIGLTRFTWLAFGLTLLVFAGQAMAFWIILLGYGIPVSFWVGAAAFLIIHFGTALPNAPANVGSYQFFCVLALTLFGVDKTAATGFSIVVFILLTLPLLGFGSVALGKSGATIAGIRKDIRALAGTK